MVAWTGVHPAGAGAARRGQVRVGRVVATAVHTTLLSLLMQGGTGYSVVGGQLTVIIPGLVHVKRVMAQHVKGAHFLALSRLVVFSIKEVNCQSIWNKE